MSILTKSKILATLFIGLTINIQATEQKTAIFADEHNPDRIIAVDYKNMKVIDTHYIQGELNHHADVIGNLKNSKYIMMVPKGSRFVTFRKKTDRSFVKKLDLPFQPRSGDAYNSRYNLTLLTSSNRPSAVLIDNRSLKIVGRAGFNIRCNAPSLNELYENSNISSQTCTAPDFGGSQISGHPMWLNSNNFAILDRSNRVIHVYNIRRNYWTGEWRTRLVDRVKTETSIHQMIPFHKYSNTFYAMAEGNFDTKVPARMYKLRFFFNHLRIIKSTPLKTNGVTGIGGHNLYMTPNRRYLYGATASGSVFVVNTHRLNIRTTIKAGAGAGHVNFMKNGRYGAVTNHQADYVTIFDYKRHKFVKNIQTPFEKQNIASLLHSHSPYIEGKYFYNFWTDGGVFYRINLRTLTLDKSVKVGGIPIQGNYFKKIVTQRQHSFGHRGPLRITSPFHLLCGI